MNRNDLLQSRLIHLRIVQRFIEEFWIASLENDIPRRDRHAADLQLFADSTSRYAGMVRAELQREGIDWRTL